MSRIHWQNCVRCEPIAIPVLPDVRIYPHVYGFSKLWKKVRILGKIRFLLVKYEFFHLNFLEKWKFHTDFFIYLNYSLKAYLYLLQKWSWGPPKICHFWTTIMHWNGKVHFKAEHRKKTDYIVKYKRKLCRIKFPKEKIPGCITLSTPGMELAGYKDLHFWNIIMHSNEKVHFNARGCKKYRFYLKILQTKVVQN